MSNDMPMQGASDFPESAKALNWGAFWWYWIWGPVHGHWLALAIFVVAIIASMIFPPLSIAPPIYYLIKGNEIAWASKQWPSVEAFHATQRNWAKWGTIVAVGFMVIGLGIGILGAMMFAGSMMTMMH